ncbi:MAG: hypothetical protein FH761_17795 [Firmicutes bacterium]|nr:hypothetical protein [Bacillota bacterium]
MDEFAKELSKSIEELALKEGIPLQKLVTEAQEILNKKNEDDSLPEYECINCGHKAWSLREVRSCSKCGSTAVRIYVEKNKTA